jgi:organic hydroperoxide reductase OsmC/OhrA
MTTATTEKTASNGVNVEALFGAREALTKAPEAAQFKWRATCEWVKGTQSRSTVQEFYGLGAEQKHKTKFTFDSDHPEVFASEDSGATPVEIVLAGLAGCLTAGIAAVAQARDIQLRSVSATLEAGMDIRTCATASMASRSSTRSTRMPRPTTSRRWSPSRKSAPPCTTSSPTRPTSRSR